MTEQNIVRAERDDYWYRHLLKPSEIHADDVSRLKYWEHVFQLPKEEREWVLEVSGRVYSLRHNIADNASIKAAELNATYGTAKYSFRGVYYGKVGEIAADPPAVFDVWIEPLPDDAAHAEMVLLANRYVDETGKITADIILDHLLRVILYAGPGSAVLQGGGALAP